MKTLMTAAMLAATLLTTTTTAQATNYGSGVARYDIVAQVTCDSYQRLGRAWRENAISDQDYADAYHRVLLRGAGSNVDALRQIVADHQSDPNGAAQRLYAYCQHVPTFVR